MARSRLRPAEPRTDGRSWTTGPVVAARRAGEGLELPVTLKLLPKERDGRKITGAAMQAIYEWLGS